MHLSLQDGGWTPLMRASARGHAECVKLLLDRGAQANLQSKVSQYSSVAYPGTGALGA